MHKMNSTFLSFTLSKSIQQEQKLSLNKYGNCYVVATCLYILKKIAWESGSAIQYVYRMDYVIMQRQNWFIGCLAWVIKHDVPIDFPRRSSNQAGTESQRVGKAVLIHLQGQEEEWSLLTFPGFADLPNEIHGLTFNISVLSLISACLKGGHGAFHWVF